MTIKQHFKEFLQKDKYHWFEVRYIYTKNNNKMFDWVTQIGVKSRNTILNRRSVKTIPAPLHKTKEIKHLLCNGQLDVEVLCYLGYLKWRNHLKTIEQ